MGLHKLTPERIEGFYRSLELVKAMSTMGLMDVNAQYGLLKDALRDEPDDLDYDSIKEVVARTYNANINSTKIDMALTDDYAFYLDNEDEVQYLKTRGISFTVARQFYLYLAQCAGKDLSALRRDDTYSKEYLFTCLHDYRIVGSLNKMVTDNHLAVSQLIKALIDVVCTGNEEPTEAADKIMMFINKEVLHVAVDN